MGWQSTPPCTELFEPSVSAPPYKFAICCKCWQAAQAAAEEQAEALRAEFEQALEAQGALAQEAQEGASPEEELAQLREELEQRGTQLQVRRGE